MKLLKLELKNFKGIRKFTLDCQGQNVNIYGENATGKTSLYDAFLWLLFGKDSQNKKDFDIKTLDADGRAIPNIDHDVEGVFEINGQIITLKKSYKEKWTRKRGSATSEFTGHTTEHFINGVPVSEKEYNAQISQIANEETFKLLTNPAYFNAHLKWQDRRKVLLEVCGDLSDAEVIASDEALSKLPEILQGKALDDHRKIIAAKRAAINKELQTLPVRIDEVQLGLPDVSGIDLAEVEQKLVDLRKQSKEKEQQVIRIESGGEAAEKNKQLAEINTKLLGIKNQYWKKYDDLINKAQGSLYGCEATLIAWRDSLKLHERSLASSHQEIAKINEDIVKLREAWHQVNGEAFESEQENVCPACGQFLPAEQIEAARAKALAAFNHNKATKLENINGAGKTHKAKIEDLAKGNTRLNLLIQEQQDKIQAKESEMDELTKKIADLKEQADSYASDPDYINALAQRAKLTAETDALRQGSSSEISKALAESAALAADIRHLESQQDAHKRHKQGQVRIEELKAQEKALAAEYEQLEGELYLTEEFIRAKVKLLEEKINSRFKLARFKLFDTQINGGLVETCQTTFNGVPYDSGLNNSMKINIGLDVINTLSEHYGFTAPIFIDNREAVTKLIETKSQVINLIVSENDKALRTELEV